MEEKKLTDEEIILSEIDLQLNEACFGIREAQISSMRTWDVLKEMREKIIEADKLAISEGIKANTVALNEKYAKINGFSFKGGFGELVIPPMIMGLELKISDGEFPEDVAFALLQLPSERDKIRTQTRQETVKEVLEKVLSFVAENEVGMKWLIRKTAREYGVELAGKLIKMRAN